MICEKCGQRLDSTRCSGCGEMVLRLGSFCYKCGAGLEASAQEITDEASGPDFSTRILCSDGTCIGVVNEEGICKICGKPYASEA